MPATPTDTPPGPPATSRASRRRAVLIGGVIVVVVLLAAVLYTALSGGGGTAASGQVAAPVAFTASTEAGQQVRVPDGKPSVVLFFSATCGSCGPAARALAQVQQTNPGAANFVAVDLEPGETVTDIAGFLTANQATTLAATSDTVAHVSAAMGVTQLTTAVFLTADGHVQSRVVEPTAAQIQDQLHTASAA